MRRKRKRAPGAGRPRNAEPSRSIAVRISAAEQRALARIAESPSEAIHALIAPHVEPETKSA